MSLPPRPALRTFVAGLLVAGTAEEILFVLRPSRRMAAYFADEIAARPDYLAEAGRWALFPVGIASLTEVIIALLGAALLLRAWERPAGRSLAVFLAISGLGLPPVLGITPKASDTVSALMIIPGMAALLHFSTVFPEPLDRRAPGWPPRWLRDLLKPWPLLAGTAGLLLWFALGSAFYPGLGDALVATVLIAAVVLAMANLRAGYRRAEPAGRRRLLWVLNGFYAVFWTIVLGLALGMVVGFLNGLTGQQSAVESDMVFYSLVNFGVLLLPLSLAVGMFYDGAFDPRMAIGKTSVYGAMGAVMVGVFVASEALVSTRLMSMLNLPQHLGPVVAASSVAIAFVPLRRWVEGRAERVVERLLPVTALAEAVREDAVIVFADICGYTRITAQDERAALTLASLFHTASRHAAEHRRGRLVKTLGDGVVLSFPDADAALDASFELRARFHAAAGALGLATPEIQVGVHRGLVARGRDGDLFGDVVNVASRLEGAAGAGALLMSHAVAGTLQAPHRFPLYPAGAVTLKNVPAPVQCVRCALALPALGTPAPPARPQGGYATQTPPRWD